jgi:hypothetical protein
MKQGVLFRDLPAAAPVEVIVVDGRAVFVAANGALAGVAGEVGLGNPTAAPAEDFFELHVADSFLRRPPVAALRAV